MVEFHPSEYTNDPYIISQNNKQVSINAALSIDFTGQVNSDSIGNQFYSGIGGQVDFTRGAGRAIDGKPIIVLPSTAKLKDGTTGSRIVHTLKPGAGVVVTRGDVHYVVTEWGIAYLHGKSIRDRVLEMINIAHPDFREELLERAKDWNYVYSDQKLPKSIDGRISVYPQKYEKTIKIKTGETVFVRPVKPTDERHFQELHYSLDKDDRYLRFFAAVRDFRHQKMQPMVNIDYATDMVLVVMNEEGKEIIAIGGFFKTHKPTLAELAFITHKDWRGKGITRLLLNYLVTIARELKFKAFSGSVLLQNKPMLHIITKSGYQMISSEIDSGVMDFIIDISK